MKIKDTYVGVAILIAIISIIFFISISQKNTNNTEISYQNELIKDSIRTEYTKKIISLRDSLIVVSEQKVKQASEKTNLLKKQIGSLKDENSRLKIIYSENHTLQNCDSLLSNQTKITDKQDSSILSLSNEVSELTNINYQLKLNNSSKDSLLSSKDNINDMANKNIAQLKKELDNKNTWIKRNGYWITFSIGLVGGVFLMR